MAKQKGGVFLCKNMRFLRCIATRSGLILLLVAGFSTEMLHGMSLSQMEPVIGAGLALLTGKELMGSCPLLEDRSKYTKGAAYFTSGLIAEHLGMLFHELGHALASKLLIEDSFKRTIYIGCSNTAPLLSLSFKDIDIHIQRLIPFFGCCRYRISENWIKNIAISAAGPIFGIAGILLSRYAVNRVLQACNSKWHMPFPIAGICLNLMCLLPIPYTDSDGMKIVRQVSGGFSARTN